MIAQSDHAKKVNIILDANALFVPLQFKIDIFEQLRTLLNANFELVILSPVWRELQELAESRSPKMRRNALFALKLAEKCTLVTVDEKLVSSVDESIVKTSAERGWAVFTNDKKLRKKLRDINVPVIYVRHKSRLEIDGRL